MSCTCNFAKQYQVDRTDNRSNEQAFRNGDWKWQERMMNAIVSAYEKSMVGFKYVFSWGLLSRADIIASGPTTHPIGMILATTCVLARIESDMQNLTAVVECRELLLVLGCQSRQSDCR